MFESSRITGCGLRMSIAVYATTHQHTNTQIHIDGSRLTSIVRGQHVIKCRELTLLKSMQLSLSNFLACILSLTAQFDTRELYGYKGTFVWLFWKRKLLTWMFHSNFITKSGSKKIIVTIFFETSRVGYKKLHEKPCDLGFNRSSVAGRIYSRKSDSEGLTLI
eukprot:GILK01019591.1.p1 GENE.GILK01019591.1~~GILK01019591.1.p1  ORF type:complete len:163 (-),score=7.50 GILK01019591.1:589-1077(-)